MAFSWVPVPQPRSVTVRSTGFLLIRPGFNQRHCRQNGRIRHPESSATRYRPRRWWDAPSDYKEIEKASEIPDAPFGFVSQSCSEQAEVRFHVRGNRHRFAILQGRTEPPLGNGLDCLFIQA